MRFLLVDRILELDPLKSIIAEKWIDPGEDYFQDHFPGYPIVPGVLMVEMMAQTAGKCLMAGIDKAQWPVLIRIVRASFRKIVQPNATLRLHASITASNRATATAEGFITHDDQRVAEATLLFGYVDKGLLTENFEDEVLRSYLRERGAQSP